MRDRPRKAAITATVGRSRLLAMARSPEVEANMEKVLVEAGMNHRGERYYREPGKTAFQTVLSYLMAVEHVPGERAPFESKDAISPQRVVEMLSKVAPRTIGSPRDAARLVGALEEAWMGDTLALRMADKDFEDKAPAVAPLQAHQTERVRDDWDRRSRIARAVDTIPEIPSRVPSRAEVTPEAPAPTPPAPSLRDAVAAAVDSHVEPEDTTP